MISTGTLGLWGQEWDDLQAALGDQDLEIKIDKVARTIDVRATAEEWDAVLAHLRESRSWPVVAAIEARTVRHAGWVAISDIKIIVPAHP